MAKPDKYFMGSGRDYPRQSVMVTDYQNPNFSFSEFRMWLSEALNYQLETIYQDGSLAVWGTKREEATSLIKEWLVKNNVAFTSSHSLQKKFGVNDTDLHMVKVTLISGLPFTKNDKK